MNLSYEEILNLIKREREKYSSLAKEEGYAADHNRKVAYYSSKAINNFEKSVKHYLAKKYN